MMAKKKGRKDILESRVYLNISEEFSDEEAAQLIRDEICKVIEDSVRNSRDYNQQGKRIDTRVGVLFGLDNHEAWIELRRRAYDALIDCDYLRECPRPRLSAHLCCTSAYKNCKYYKTPSKPIARGPFGKVFGSNPKKN